MIDCQRDRAGRHGDRPAIHDRTAGGTGANRSSR